MWIVNLTLTELYILPFRLQVSYKCVRKKGFESYALYRNIAGKAIT